MDSKIKNFFYPSKIALIGASSKEKSIGFELLRSIKSFGFKGKVLLVNPNVETILGYKCLNSISYLPDEIDLAIVAVPKQFVEDSIIQLIKKNIQSIILVTAGFKEIGEEGAILEKKVIEIIKISGSRLVGPNCMGVINTLDEVKLNATFVAERPEKGGTAFLSQSGAIGAAVLNSLRNTDIKFCHFISVGNKGDINENDLLSFWQSDDNIKTITFYLESFVDGENLIKKVFESNFSKPIIILKAGRTKDGINAASSHTGAIGSSDRVVESVLHQLGIIRANNLNELFNTSKGFENFPLPFGNKIGIISNAGGPSILAVDSLAKENLTLAILSEETKLKLKNIVHPDGSINNPVDLLPLGTAAQFKEVNQILLEDENVDAVISIFVEPVMVKAIEVIESVNSILSSKPIYQVVMPLPEFWEDYRKSPQNKKPLFKTPEEPAEVISNILFYQKSREKYIRITANPNNQFRFESKNSFASTEDVDKLLRHYKIPVVKTEIIVPEVINKIIESFSFPIVLKGISKNVIHKSEFNAVKVNIKNINELLEAEMEILQSFKEKKIHLDEFLVQPFIKPRFELLIGGFRDPSFGPMIMFGSGGKYVEVFNDTTIRSAYLSEFDIVEMISETKIGTLLKGVRGENPVNMGKVIEIIKSSAQLLLDNNSISEFDINPVIISDNDSIYSVDTRIKLNLQL